MAWHLHLPRRTLLTRRPAGRVQVIGRCVLSVGVGVVAVMAVAVTAIKRHDGKH